MTGKLKSVSATGQLGTGFLEESLRAGAQGAAFIGCDAGSTDAGPHYLGSGLAQSARDSVKRDMRMIISAARDHDIPVLIGSAGTAGARPHLHWMLDIVRELAREHSWHFRLGSVDTELDRDFLLHKLEQSAISPLDPAPPLDPEVIEGASHLVGMAGSEPFQRALAGGAQVVIAGRTSDVSIFAAVPLLRGIPHGVAWHAGKILECGAASVEQRVHPDSMVAELDDSGFVVYPPNPRMRCTPTSVVSHTLYENADPYHLYEPGGMLDTTECEYSAVDDRAVRVTGSAFHLSPSYTVKIEGAILAGYRAIAIAGIRDPLVLRQLDSFLSSLDQVVKKKAQDSLRLGPNDFSLRWRTYGQQGSLGALEPLPIVEGHEVGLLIDVVAKTQEVANGLCSIAWHTGLHHPIPEYSGLISNLAFPYSPPGTAVGPAYRFCANHLLQLNDPCEPFSIAVEDV